MEIKQMIKGLIKSYGYPLYEMMLRNAYIEQTNINLNLCDSKQKKVLICYLPIPNVDFGNTVHAAYAHINQIIHTFIEMGYCIDVCFANDVQQYDRLSKKKYDIVFGFGAAFKQACKDNTRALKISFIMENHPDAVAAKYQERLDYFHKRHPNISTKTSFSRTGYFDTEQFRISDVGILMNSRYNALNFKEFSNKGLYLINSNSIFNKEFLFERNINTQCIASSRNNFLWFGSNGLIHKGLDVVIDAFKQMPELTLNCYGIGKFEYALFDKIKAPNILNCHRVNVSSSAFISSVVMRHNFMILDSCSEGMSTAVSTCMAHGIIPIISKECGFNEASCIIQLEDNSVNGVIEAIRHTFEMTDDMILAMREECYNYARRNFSLECFDEQFKKELKEILVNNNIWL